MTRLNEIPFSYRDLLLIRHGPDIGSVVGCALDRLGRSCSPCEIDRAIDYYKTNESRLLTLPIGARRDDVARYMEDR